MSDSESLVIESPQGGSLIACAGFLYDHTPLAQRGRLVAELIRQTAANNAVLVGAKEHDRLVAAVAAQIMPGRQAFVQSPKIAAVSSEAVLDRLWAELESRLRERGIEYLQAILTPDVDSEHLAQVGMQTIATLSFLAANVEQRPSEHDDLDFEPFAESESERLRGLVDRTYAESADCPAVDGMRSLDDVMAGYRGAGNFNPANWFFVRRNGEDIGCLLLADHPDANQFELVYMGLVVEARGHGLGITLTEFAKAMTAQAGRMRIFVSVDTANQPAVKTYTRCGFHSLQEQRVFAKSLASPT